MGISSIVDYGISGEQTKYYVSKRFMKYNEMYIELYRIMYITV